MLFLRRAVGAVATVPFVPVIWKVQRIFIERYRRFFAHALIVDDELLTASHRSAFLKLCSDRLSNSSTNAAMWAHGTHPTVSAARGGSRTNSPRIDR